jgi:ABC-type Fe3+ transport system permease subunit
MSDSLSPTRFVNGRARAAYLAFLIGVVVLSGYAIMRLFTGVPAERAVPMISIGRAAAVTLAVSFTTVGSSLVIGSAIAAKRRRRDAATNLAMPMVAFAALALLLGSWPVLANLAVININTPLMLSFVAAVLPLSVWQIKVAFERVPNAVADAAKIDGCSGWQRFRHVTLPVIAPAVGAVAIFAAIVGWICIGLFQGPPIGSESLVVFGPPLLLFVVLGAVVGPKLRSPHADRPAR